jgi:hypothetical protein
VLAKRWCPPCGGLGQGVVVRSPRPPETSSRATSPVSPASAGRLRLYDLARLLLDPQIGYPPSSRPTSSSPLEDPARVGNQSCPVFCSSRRSAQGVRVGRVEYCHVDGLDSVVRRLGREPHPLTNSIRPWNILARTPSKAGRIIKEKGEFLHVSD